VIKRGLFILLIWCSFALAAFGQHTTVSATIQDANGQAFAFGTYKISFFSNGLGGPFFLAGAPFDPGTTFSGVLDSTGSFAGVSVPSSNFITPVGTAWFVTVCPAATTACFTKTIPITGGTMNLTGLVVPPAVGVPASQYNQAAAYRDTEIQGPYLGFTYYNLTDSTLHVCTGATACTWVSVGSGGGGGSPAGSDTQVQFNKAGSFGATSGFGVDNSTTPTVLNVPFSATFAGPKPWYDVTSPVFGAKGDGTTDDTAAIQGAMNAACAANAGTVYLPTPPAFYKVTQVQTGTSPTASPLNVNCQIHILGQNSTSGRAQFSTAPAVTITVTPGASPNPAPLFSISGSGAKQATLENLMLNCYNECIYVGGGTSNTRILNVNTSINGATGIGTAAQPNAAEVYGSQIWLYRIGGTALSNSFTTPSIIILNDNAPQPPGILDFENLVTVGVINAHSIVNQSGTAGDWILSNVSIEDSSLGYLLIDDDGTHHWSQINSINIKVPGVSDGTYPAFIKLNSGTATSVVGITMDNPDVAIPGAALVQVCAGSVAAATVTGNTNAPGGAIIDCSGNVTGNAAFSNGTGFDYYTSATISSRTDLQQFGAGSALRTFLPGSTPGSTYATTVIDAKSGYGLGVPTAFGPDASIHEATQGQVDVEFQTIFAPTSVTNTPVSGGSIATGVYTFWVLSSTSGGCVSTATSPPSLPTIVTLSGGNNSVTISWALPIAGVGTPIGYCVISTGGNLPNFNNDGSYRLQFISGASTTSATFTAPLSGCCANFTPSGNLSAVTHFTPQGVVTPVLDNIVYVDGIIYPRTNVGIQAAVAATPSGGTVILPPGTYALTGTGSEEILITGSLHFQCSGWGTVLQVGASVPTTTDIIHIKPSGFIRDVSVEDCNIEPVSGTPGRYGISVDENGNNANQVANLQIIHNEIGQLGGTQSIASINTVTGGNGVVWGSTIRDNQLFAGTLWAHIGDSFNFLRNVVTGSGACAEVDQVAGASHFVGEGNNCTTAGGAFVVHGAFQPKWVFNQNEQTVTSTETNGAIIDLLGDDYTIDTANVSGNNLNAHTFSAKNMYVAGAINALIENNGITVQATTGVGITIASGADSTSIGPNTFIGTSGGAVSTLNSGTHTQYFASRGTNAPGTNLWAPSDTTSALVLNRNSSSTSGDIFEVQDQLTNPLMGVLPNGSIFSATLESSATTSTCATPGGVITIISCPGGGSTPGVATRVVGGTTSTDTILTADCTPAPGRVAYQGSVAVAVTLPTATTLGCTNAVFRLTNNTTGSATAVTVTPTTWTVRGGSTIIIAQGRYATFYVDPAGTSWDVDDSDQPMTAGTGITITRGQYGPTINSAAGGIPALSAVTASISPTTIANGNNNETWQCSLTSTTDCFDIAESAPSSGTGAILSAGTLATSTAFPFRAFVTGSATSTFGNQVALDVDNLTAATSSQNQSSPISQNCGNIWNGAATKDCFTQTATYAAGTNPAVTMTYGHSGSTGQVIYAWPGTPQFNLNTVHITGGLVEGTTGSVAMTFQSGLDGAGTAIGAAAFRGGDITGGATAINAGAVTLRGGNVNVNTNTGATAGSVTIQGGVCTAVASATTCNGQVKINNAQFTTGTAAANDLACVTAANTIASCSSTGTGQFVGVIDSTATDDIIVTSLGSGGAHIFNAASATFTNGHFVCQSASTANLVVDSATVCTAGFGIGIYIGATGTQTAPLVAMRSY
jgi:Pectate lyase superfamily protein